MSLQAILRPDVLLSSLRQQKANTQSTLNQRHFGPEIVSTNHPARLLELGTDYP